MSLLGHPRQEMRAPSWPPPAGPGKCGSRWWPSVPLGSRRKPARTGKLSDSPHLCPEPSLGTGGFLITSGQLRSRGWP